MDAPRISNRLRKELESFVKDPPSGIFCCIRDNFTTILDANIIGPPGSPYEEGVFHLEVQLPKEYPFQPPRVVFITPIYHPNIDESGRICLDLLKLPPSGSWRCTTTIANVLIAVQCLLASPNPSDPLNPEIAALMQSDMKQFEKIAKEHTLKYCRLGSLSVLLLIHNLRSSESLCL
ncbi:ubiquitin-conjugating enzyme E2 T [Halyomorpha halys]|uniref:ubiquitin-conjugating enzyme E2 T n=1 Tax=Halyomorpha halys TaxID=286706 RepID=UPI0006D4D3FE|nr:ubiquitin-conjugating enzyme E2 T-like [Halyomorpha halys]